MIVDTHCHVSEIWYEPVETLLCQMDRNGVDRAWLVQPLGVYDNAYQQRCRARHPDRFVSIVGIDWMAPDAIAELERLADEGAQGVRLRPAARSTGDDPLAIWRAADRLRLVVSCIGTAAQFADPDFAPVAAQFPNLPIVLEHLGGLARPDVGDVAAATVPITGLAGHTNLFLKVPGLGQLLPRAVLDGRQQDLPTPVAAMLDAFGPERLAWGSDFPVVSTREGYANALEWTRAALPPAARAATLGDTASGLPRAPLRRPAG